MERKEYRFFFTVLEPQNHSLESPYLNHRVSSLQLKVKLTSLRSLLTLTLGYKDSSKVVESENLYFTSFVINKYMTVSMHTSICYRL